VTSGALRRRDEHQSRDAGCEELDRGIEASPDDPSPRQRNCSVVHALAGRARLRVLELKWDSGLADRLQEFLDRQAGIRATYVAAACASLVVTFDPDVVGLDQIVRWVQDSELPDFPDPAPHRSSQSPDLGTFLCGGLALGLNLLGAPALLTTGLLAASVLPIFLRASRDLAVERRLSVDALDATAISALWLQGNLFTASATSCLIAGGEYIRALTARRSHRAVVDLLGTTGQFAWVVRDGRKEQIPAGSVAAGETVVVYPGDRVLVDGVVMRGRALVDEKVLTGEATPGLKGPGDTV
jgi:Cu2+-exporting ATPase